MITYNNKDIRVLELMTLFLYLFAIYPWPTWQINFRIVWGMALISYTYLLVSKPFLFASSKEYMPYSIALLLMLAWMNKNSIAGFVFGLGNFWCIYLLLRLREGVKYELIHFITKWLSIIIGVSLVAFILHFIGFPMPHSSIRFLDNIAYDYFDNYYFFITNAGSNRFQSIFLEPGHMTMGLAPILFLNKYDFKNRYVLVLLISQLFSFSLAGYISLIFGFIWITFTNNIEKKFTYIFSFLCVFFLIVVGINSLSNSNIFSELILDRLRMEDGQIIGYNRTNALFDDVYDSFIKSGDIWMGQASSTTLEDLFKGHGNAGYQLFIFMEGMISFILVVVCYSYPILFYKKKCIVGYCILLLLLLSQNSYPLWWTMMIALVVGSGAINYVNKFEYENTI